MWEDLENLHELGILVRDIQAGNYMGGKLVDLSRSWTTPSPSFDYISLENLWAQRQADPHGLHKAIIDWGLENHWDWDEVVIPDELEKCASGEGKNDKYGTDPTRYNWRRMG
jgi:hypothetical protein